MVWIRNMSWSNWSPGIPIRFDYRAQVLVARVTRRTSLKSKRLLLHQLPVIRRKSPAKPKPTHCIFVGVSSSFSERNDRRKGVMFIILISFASFSVSWLRWWFASDRLRSASNQSRQHVPYCLSWTRSGLYCGWLVTWSTLSISSASIQSSRSRFFPLR